MTICRELAEASPTEPRFQQSVAPLNNIGNALPESGDAAGAMASLSDAQTHLEAARRLDPADVRIRECYFNVHSPRANALTRLGRHADALPEWDTAVELASPKGKIAVRLSHAVSRARRARRRRRRRGGRTRPPPVDGRGRALRPGASTPWPPANRSSRGNGSWRPRSNSCGSRRRPVISTGRTPVPGSLPKRTLPKCGASRRVAFSWTESGRRNDRPSRGTGERGVQRPDCRAQ